MGAYICSTGNPINRIVNVRWKSTLSTENPVSGWHHVIFEPLDFIARLVALVPKPRVNLTRLNGVFAPNSKHRVQMTSAKRCKGKNALQLIKRNLSELFKSIKRGAN